MSQPEITLSVVSHGQNTLVNNLLVDIQRLGLSRIALILTENIADATPLAVQGLACPVERIANTSPKGFGANHNYAFTRCRTPFFCVVNPDIRLKEDPFPRLRESVSTKAIAVAGPKVVNSAGAVEDSARRYPTLASLVLKLFARKPRRGYPTDHGPIEVDWVAGMFMLFASEAFRKISGFDERYFLYYEDVDLCFRLRAGGHGVVYDPRSEVIHDAQRASRRNPRLALHHVSSAARFLTRR
jgi:GT2 family glycosyltransferase